MSLKNKYFHPLIPGKKMENDWYDLPVQQNVWVGFRALILPGVTLGRGCIVGSNMIVDEVVPPSAVVAGHPMRVIKFLDPTNTPTFKKNALNFYSAK